MHARLVERGLGEVWGLCSGQRHMEGDIFG